MRYEGVFRATTSAALICGLVFVLSGCGRALSRVGPSPTAEISSSPTVESPATTSPSADTTVPTPPSTASTPPGTGSTPPPLSIASLTFPSGEVGIAYPVVALAASGGRPPYGWSISSGSLPTGLTLSASAVSGTPSIAGPFSFTVQVTDSGGGSAGVGESITIAASLAVSGSCATQCSVEEGCVTVCGTFGSQSGGVASYTYALSGGALPNGMILNGLSLAGPFPPGQISVTGAPIPYKFTVKVTDALGAQASIDAVFYVFPHIALKGGTFSQKVGTSFAVSLPYSGGTPGGIPKVALAKGTLPPSSALSVDPKMFQVVITVPAQRVAGSYTAVLALTDGSPCSPNGNCSAAATVTISLG